ncbi:11344_t:CDS:2 [Rhizophagus irregularis]|nr:11344_t:CDS:2 [Rhizophagus irregularis]
MIAAERSTSITKSCLVLVEFLAMNYIKYIDFAIEEEKVSSEKGPIKTILSTASKKVLPQVKKDVVSTQKNTPVVSPEILKKSEAVRKSTSTPTNTANKNTEASPALSIFAELSLRKAEKDQLSLDQRHRPSVPSSLGGSRTGDWKSLDYYPSKRHSSPAPEKPKRTTTMKLMNSTAANRVLKIKPQLKEINLNLFDERPSLSQPPRKHHLNKSPGMNLQIARRYLKAMVKVRKHRNTI